MKSYVQILGTETEDTDPSVLLFFDSERYLFNAGENTFRFCTEHRIKLSRVGHIFLSSLSPYQTGGLPGLMLTLADTGVVDRCQVHGPRNLVHQLLSMKYFMRRKDLLLRVKEIHHDCTSFDLQANDALPAPVHADSNVTIRAICVEIADVHKAQQRALNSDSEYNFTGNVTFVEEFREREWLTEELQFPWRFHQAKGQELCGADNDGSNEQNEAMYTAMLSEKQENFASEETNEQQSTMTAAATEEVQKEEDSGCVHSPASKRQRVESGRDTAILTHFGRWNLEVDTAVMSRIKAEKLEHGESLPIVQRSAISYICQTADIPGKFDAKKARALGINPGPQYGMLTRGMSVTTEDGRTVTPDMVISPSKPGPIIILVHCPSMDFINQMTEHPHWHPYFPRPDKKHFAVNCVIHSAPAEVVETDQYMQFMERFGSDCQHIVVNKKSCPSRVIFQSSVALHCKLNAIDDKVFPLPHFDTPLTHNVPSAPLMNKKKIKIVAGDNLLKFQLSPIKLLGLDKSEVVKDLSVQEIQQELLRNNDVVKQMIAEYKQLASLENAYMGEGSNGDQSLNGQMHNPSYHERILREMGDRDASLVFLGTGSACPSKYRNVSSTYLNFFERGGLLMDCGEGTYGQLYRVYGPQHIDDILLNLKCIWVSHTHADHHLGICKLLSKRTRAMKKRNIDPSDDRYRLTLLCNEFIKSYIDNFNLCFSDDIYHYDFVDCRETQTSDHTQLDRVCTALELQHMFTVRVDHSCETYGLVLTHNRGWKFVHSGDTRPCENLIKAGQGATVLVHEATFENSMTEEAVAKKHSTTQEAIESGVKMGAYRIILTHFSQRYPKIPVFDKSFTEITSIAFDMMVVNFKHLYHLPKILAPVQEIFKEEHSAMAKDSML